MIDAFLDTVATLANVFDHLEAIMSVRYYKSVIHFLFAS